MNQCIAPIALFTLLLYVCTLHYLVSMKGNSESIKFKKYVKA